MNLPLLDDAEQDNAPANALTINAPIESLVKAHDEAITSATSAIDSLGAAYHTWKAAEAKIEQSSGGFCRRLASNARLIDSLPHSFDDEELADAKALAVKEIRQDWWRQLIHLVGVKALMDRTAINDMEESLSDDPPEFTIENITATITEFMASADDIFRRGVAVAFSDLDRRFRSHDGFKVGSRIILDGLYDTSYSFASIRHEKEAMLRDVLRALSVVDGKEYTDREMYQILRTAKDAANADNQGTTEWDYFRLRTFKNGNAHFWFRRDDLVEKINKILAEWYGEVLADGVAADADFRSTSRELSKDLAFYPTPDAVADEVIERINPHGEKVKILEPSAGEGALIEAWIRYAKRYERPTGAIRAIEVDPARAAKIKRHKSVSVQIENFLNVFPHPSYDYVLMNPPFANTHWMDHVIHAMKFVKPGGRLIAILPVTAEIGESARHIKFREWMKPYLPRYGVAWRDLPAQSFKASGTNINTLTLTLEKQE